MNDNTQDTIINGIVEGDDIIIKAFYKKHLPQVTNYVVTNSGSITDAEDIFQDAMVFVYQKLKSDTLQLNCSLGTYIYSVSKNMWRNSLRKNRKMVISDDVLIISGVDEGHIVEEIHEKERNTLYQKYFMKLGEGCRGILELFFLGFSMKEIATQKEYTEKYARKKKFECKKKLMAMVEDDPIYEELKASSK